MFASHLVGYAQYDEKSDQLVGQMGLEATLNDYLTGKDKRFLLVEVNALVLPGTSYTKKYAENGNNVYLNFRSKCAAYLTEQLGKNRYTGKCQGWLGNRNGSRNR